MNISKESWEQEALIREAGISQEVLGALEARARDASDHSYSPYSRFPVGAAVLTESGRIFTGCNVENASYGLTNCAERTAVYKAISEGEQAIKAVAVCTPTEVVTPPCGACRQVLYEFGPHCVVIAVGVGTQRKIVRLDSLLPEAFGPHHL